MTNLLIMTHGTFGAAMLATAEQMLGPQLGVKALSLGPEAGREDLFKLAATELQALGGETLILVDMLGGTPWNVGFLLSAQPPHEVLSGISLPLLVEALTQRARLGARELGTALRDIAEQTLAQGSVLLKGAQQP